FALARGVRERRRWRHEPQGPGVNRGCHPVFAEDLRVALLVLAGAQVSSAEGVRGFAGADLVAVAVIDEGHGAVLGQVQGPGEPPLVDASQAAAVTSELLRRLHAGLLPAQGVGVFVPGETGDRLLLCRGDL